MAFDAGAIKGSLELDNSSFMHGMSEAIAQTQLFGPLVTEMIENPLLGAAAAMKELGAKEIEAFKEVLGNAQEMALSAEKIGASTEWLSRWSAVAKTANIDTVGLANGIFTLDQQIGEALNGDKRAQKGFEDLGISMAWLQDHAGDTEAIFDELERKISAIPEPSKRAAAAHDALGKASRELAPIFAKSAEEIQHLIDMQKQLGAVTDEAEGKQALRLKNLQTEYAEAMEGIQKTIAKPFIDFLSAHETQIETGMVKISGSIRDAINSAFSGISGDKGKELFGDLKSAAHELIADLPPMHTVLNEIVVDLDQIVKLINETSKAGHEAVSYLSGGDGSGSASADDLLKQIQGGDRDPEDLAEFLRSKGFKIPGTNTPIQSGWIKRNQGAADAMLQQAGIGAQTPADQQGPDSYQQTANTLSQHGITDDLGNPVDAGWVRRHRAEAQRDMAKINGGVTIQNLNITVTPDSTARAIGDAVKKKMDQAQALANSQASVGGGG